MLHVMTSLRIVDVSRVKLHFLCNVFVWFKQKPISLHFLVDLFWWNSSNFIYFFLLSSTFLLHNPISFLCNSSKTLLLNSRFSLGIIQDFFVWYKQKLQLYSNSNFIFLLIFHSFHQDVLKYTDIEKELLVAVVVNWNNPTLMPSPSPRPLGRCINC